MIRNVHTKYLFNIRNKTFKLESETEDVIP